MIRKKKNFKSSNVKSKRRPQHMSEKIQFWTPDKKNKKEGGGSKYVGEHWPCDNSIKNDKKEGRWSNYVRDHQPHQDRKKL